MNRKRTSDRGVNPRAGSGDRGSLDASAEALMDQLTRHFPPPPAIILVGGHGPTAYGDELFKRGYQVNRGDPFGESPPDGLSNGYEVILLSGPLEEGIPLTPLLRRVRDFLKPGGLAAFGVQRYRQDDLLKKPEHQLTRKLITGLYENGFSIQAKETCMTIARKTSIFLHPYRQGDETAILEMFQQVFQTQRTMAHWYWKFRDNPFGAHKIVQAVDENGTLAGHYSGYPVPFCAPAKQNKSFLSLQIGDIMTRPGFRNAGLGKTSVLGRITDYFHHQFCMDQIPFMYGFVAGNHRKFGERFLHYRYMPGIPYHVLDLGNRKMRKPGGIKQMLSGVRVTEVPHITPDFDLFFQKAARDYGMLVRRDAAYLKWRYVDCPDGGGYRIFVVKRFGKLVGWSIFKQRGTVLLWGDALFSKNHLQVAETLLAEVIGNHFQSVERIDAWFSRTPPWWSDILLRMGFKISEEPNGLVGGVTLFDPSVSFNSVADHLYYTMGDSDLF